MATRTRSGKEPQKKTTAAKPAAGATAGRSGGKPKAGKSGTRAKAGTGKAAPKKTRTAPEPKPAPEEAGLEAQFVVAPGTETPPVASLAQSGQAPEPVMPEAESDLAARPEAEALPVAEMETPPDVSVSQDKPLQERTIPAVEQRPDSMPDAPPEAVSELEPQGPVEASLETSASVLFEAAVEEPESVPVEARETALPPEASVVEDSRPADELPGPDGEEAVPEVFATPESCPDAAAPEAVSTRARDRGEARLVAAYLAGALEGLGEAVVSAASITLDPGLADLALEKLQFFGQALQLLVEAVDFAATEKPARLGPASLPRLQVRLEQRPANRLALRCYDDGRFFERALPHTHLDMEALRPLVLAVTRADGSICLRRGRCVEFEITG